MFSVTFKDVYNFLKEVTFVYIFWIALHYLSVHLYSYFCTPLSFIGFLSSPFLVTLPQCKILRWVIEEGGKMIEVMWIILGKWIIEKMLLIGKKGRFAPE